MNMTDLLEPTNNLCLVVVRDCDTQWSIDAKVWKMEDQWLEKIFRLERRENDGISRPEWVRVERYSDKKSAATLLADGSVIRRRRRRRRISLVMVMVLIVRLLPFPLR